MITRCLEKKNRVFEQIIREINVLLEFRLKVIRPMKVMQIAIRLYNVLWKFFDFLGQFRTFDTLFVTFQNVTQFDMVLTQPDLYRQYS